jgi:hypothetical protein
MNTITPLLLAVGLAGAAGAEDAAFKTGRPEIRSMSALAFAPGGILLVGDGKAGAVFALDLGDTAAREVPKEPKPVTDVEAKLAALLGVTPADVLVHDLAVNPISKNAYLSVSRGRAGLASQWMLPNDVADATVLVRIDGDGRFSVVDLASLRYAQAALPNPVDPAKKHTWKEGVTQRAETIVHVAHANGVVWVSGLSNEEFAATLWRVPYPFAPGVTATTVENYHGAHGKYETESPIRAFVQYPIGGKTEILAAYLCTPLVTFDADSLKDKAHVRGRTVGEFGSGNYPVDMIVYKNEGREKILIANSSLPLMIVDPKDIEAFKGEITSEVPGYTGGVRYEVRSSGAVQQLDNYGDAHVVALQRLMSGRLDLTPYPVRRF